MQSTERAFVALSEGAEDEGDAIARAAVEDLAAYRTAFTPLRRQIEAQNHDTATAIDRVCTPAKAAVGAGEVKRARIAEVLAAEAAATQAEPDGQFRSALASFGAALAFAALLRPLQAMQQGLQGMVGKLPQTADSIGSASREVASGDAAEQGWTRSTRPSPTSTG